MGHGTVASGIHSTAMGKETLASGSFATAMGRNTVAEGTYSLASGLNTQAQGSLSFAAGHETTAQSYAEVVLGRFNALADDSRFKDSPSPHAWSKHDALLRVGVGTSELDRKDAFAVLKDGRVCTADGTIGKCGEEDGPAAKSRERRELVQAETIRDLRAEVKALTRQGAKAAEELAELRAQMAALTNLPAELAELKAQVAQMAAVLAVTPAQRSASRRESERES